MHLGFAAGLVFALVGEAGAADVAAPQPGPAPFVEIVGRAVVETAPKRVTLPGGRKALEFQISLSSYLLAPDQPKGADRKVVVDMQGPVRVQHDLACGGELALSVGDRVDLKGEYVKRTQAGDLIRFTHAAGGAGCGDKEHPAGSLAKVVIPTPTPPVTPPRPAGIVPDQPYVGTPAAPQKAYAGILRLKQEGASDEKLLETIRAEKKVYSLSLDDMQKLRAAGVSSAVIEAMLQSGRGPITPGAKPAPTATPSS